jgi:hypothetical protein
VKRVERETIVGRKVTSTSDGYFPVVPGPMWICILCWAITLNETREDHRKVCRERYTEFGPTS